MSNNRGKPLPATTVAQIQRLRQVNSVRETARNAAVSPNTVQKYARKPSS